MATVNPEVLIAAEVEFDESKFSSPGSDLTLYFQKPENGGCGVLATLTPFQGKSGKAIVLFDPDDCEEDIVRDLNDSKSDSLLKISAYKDSKVFDETTTYIERGTEKKLLGAFKFENLRKRVRYQCGFDIELSPNSKRIKLRGNFTHIKLAEDCLKQIISDIDNKRLSVVPTVEELSAEEEESGVTQELQDLNVDSLSESTNPDETENLVTKRQAVESKSERKDIEDPEGESLHPNAQINKTTKPKSLKSDLKKINSQRTIAERLLKGHDTDLQEKEIDAEKDETEEMGSRQVEPAEDFDRIIYEYMIIENAEEFKKKITETYPTCDIKHKEDKKNINNMIVSVKGPKKKAEAAMQAINKLFSVTNGYLNSTCIKLPLSFTGDRSGLKESLKTLSGRKFVARLVTDEDIRIVGDLMALERNIFRVEQHIEEYIDQNPASGNSVDTLPPILLGDNMWIRVQYGDLLKTGCKAIVSSAARDLGSGTAIARAVNQACGPSFAHKAKQTASNQLLSDTEVCSQDAEGQLYSRGTDYVIHAAAPNPDDPNIQRTLSTLVFNAMKEAQHLSMTSLAFPAIGSAILGERLSTEAYWNGLVDFYHSESGQITTTDIVFAALDRGIVRDIHQAFNDCANNAKKTRRSPDPPRPPSSSNQGTKGATSSSSHTGGARPRVAQSQSQSHGQRGASGGVEASGGGGGFGGGGASSGGEASGGGRAYGGDGSKRGGGANRSNHVAGGYATQGSMKPDKGRMVSGRQINVNDIGNVLPHIPGHSDFPSGGRGAPQPAHNRRLTNTGGTHKQGKRLSGDSNQAGVHNYGSSNTSSSRQPSSTGRSGSSGRGSSGQASATFAKPPADDEDDYDPSNRCPICLDDFKHPKELPCKHKFCKECLDAVEATSKSHQCPVCRVPFAVAEGTQPEGGRMTTTKSGISLPGYPNCGTIVIDYHIPSGTQGPEHPKPGVRFQGTSRTGYLPDNDKGRIVERLLRRAFDQRLTFTVGTSITTGADNMVVWNDIHHKTSPHGGPQSYGYPDPDYLDRVMDDLKARGIKE